MWSPSTSLDPLFGQGWMDTLGVYKVHRRRILLKVNAHYLKYSHVACVSELIHPFIFLMFSLPIFVPCPSPLLFTHRKGETGNKATLHYQLSLPSHTQFLFPTMLPPHPSVYRWPAMVEEDPDTESYYEMGRGSYSVPVSKCPM